MKVCSVLLVMCVFLADASRKPVVNTILGALQGIEDHTPEGKAIYAFLGVPYAKPPVGKHKFEPPRPVEGWAGVWPATEPGSVCLQHMLNYHLPETEMIVGEEDCLYLNIYTPRLFTRGSALLPVLVYFHGGAFMYGSGNTLTPHYLMDRLEFVYVSVNYRLGPFGFLSTEDAVLPGNTGLKDQVTALKWVQDHVAAFGGDRDQVTIAGLSAGGASVQLHFLSPMSTGLFKRGISMSGSAFCPWVLAEKSAEKAKILAASMGCPTDTSRSMVQCLKRRPGRKILAQLKSLFWPWGTLPISPFGVVVETPGAAPFLSEHPYDLLSQGRVADLPWLASVTTEEGLYPAAAFVDREELLAQLNSEWPHIIPHVLDYNHTILPEELNTVSGKIREFYFGKEDISSVNRDKVVRMVGDRLFVADMERAARLQAIATTSPVFFYEFGYPGKYSISLFLTRHNSTMGASHADDQTYILKRPVLSPLETPEDKAMMLRMTDIWASFILGSMPSTGANVTWEPVDGNDPVNFNYLSIRSAEDIGMKSANYLGNRPFWESIHFDELQPQAVTGKLNDEL